MAPQKDQPDLPNTTDDLIASSSSTFPPVPRRTIVVVKAKDPNSLKETQTISTPSTLEPKEPKEAPKSMDSIQPLKPAEPKKRIVSNRGRYATFSPKSSARLLQAASEVVSNSEVTFLNIFLER